MATEQPSGDVPATVSGYGIVVGEHNAQTNIYVAKSLLALAALVSLNADAAVRRVRQLPHDEAVDIFANGSWEDQSAMLKVLLQRDRRLAVAILGDLEAGRCRQLVSLYVDDFTWLHALPDAAEAISEYAAEAEWDPDGDQGWLEIAAQSPKKTEGYFRRYVEGRIYWSSKQKLAYGVRSQRSEYHLASGGTIGELGFPTSNGWSFTSGFGSEGTGQEFEGGRIYSSPRGTYRVPPELYAADEDWLGYPVAEVEAVQDGVMRQLCEGGVLYSSKAGTFAVRAEFAKRARDEWVPISAEQDIDRGRVQRFRRADGMQTAVYSSGGTGAYLVTGSRLAFYEELGVRIPGSGFPWRWLAGHLRAGSSRGSSTDRSIADRTATP